MQIRDVKDRIVSGVNKAPAAPAKAKETSHAAAPAEPRDVVILSDRARLAAAGPPDPRKEKADALMNQVTSPAPIPGPRDNQDSLALKKEYRDIYTTGDSARGYASNIASAGPGSHTLPDGRIAQVSESNGITTVRIQEKGSSSYRELQFKPGDATYLQDKNVSKNFLGIESTNLLSRDGNYIKTTQGSHWLGFNWGKQATDYQLENVSGTQDMYPTINGQETMVKRIYNKTNDTTSQPSQIDVLLKYGSVFRETWQPAHLTLRGWSLVQVPGGYKKEFIGPVG